MYEDIEAIQSRKIVAWVIVVRYVAFISRSTKNINELERERETTLLTR